MTDKEFVILEAMYFHVRQLEENERRNFDLASELIDALLVPDVHKTKRDRIIIEHELNKKRPTEPETE